MEKSEIEEKVKNVISKVLKVNVEEIKTESNFIFDLGADSQQSIELVAGFEEEFNIEMDEDKAVAIQTVSDAVNFIGEYLK